MHTPNTLKRLAGRVYLANVAAKAATAHYETARRELLAGMKELGLGELATSTTLESGARVSLRAAVATPEVSVVDCVKLRGLVPVEQFLLMVSATQKSVKDNGAGALLPQVLGSRAGTENVTVEVAG